MPTLPKAYAYLREEPLPPTMVRVAVEMLGTKEGVGRVDNPVILGWADEIARATGRSYDRWAAEFINNDQIPWCGLFCAVVAARTAQGREERLPPRNYPRALSWSGWGVAVAVDDIAVGDIVVLTRDGGGHVFIAVGTSADGQWIAGLGGNQDDAVTIDAFPTSRVYAVRRPPYRARPAGARGVTLALNGASDVRMV